MDKAGGIFSESDMSGAQPGNPESSWWAGHRAAHEEGKRDSNRGAGVVGGSEEQAESLYLI